MKPRMYIIDLPTLNYQLRDTGHTPQEAFEKAYRRIDTKFLEQKAKKHLFFFNYVHIEPCLCTTTLANVEVRYAQNEHCLNTTPIANVKIRYAYKYKNDTPLETEDYFSLNVYFAVLTLKDFGELLDKKQYIDLLGSSTSTYVRRAVAQRGYLLDKFIYDDSVGVRLACVEHNYGLSHLIKDKDPHVRSAIAAKGCFLSYFVENEKSVSVLEEVIKQKYALDVFMYSKNSVIRSRVAEQGYRLDYFINDTDPFVRAVVAQKGYGLNRLVADKSEIVRRAVAAQGYGLAVLVFDTDSIVREIALRKVQEMKKKKN